MQRSINPVVLSDGYKASHFLMYPKAKQMSAFGGFRSPYPGFDDNRFVVYGMRYLVENYISIQWTEKDIEDAQLFYNTYNVGYTPLPFPKDLFLKFVKENNGYFPIKIEALPEGSVAYVGTPIYQITTLNEYSNLVTYLETVLTMLWYPSTVATLSRMTKDIIKKGFEKSVDPEFFFLLESKLHDFGFRGCTSFEQSIIGGSAHLLSFTGSDTMSASFYVQNHLNNGRPRGSTASASEHSTMTAWETEEKAFDHITDKFKHTFFSTVMDSIDYEHACTKIIPKFAPRIKENNGVIVLRPDSGDPVEAVLFGMNAAEKAFGSFKNSKGFKVLLNSAVLQGDGIDHKTISKILDAVLKEGFSAQSVSFGMGGGLLQKLNRDTMSFATKLSHIIYEDGSQKDIMKLPKTDLNKASLPGRIAVCLNEEGFPCTYPEDRLNGKKSLFEVVWDCGPVKDHKWDDFNVLISRLETQWEKIPNGGSALSEELKMKIKENVERIREERKTN